MRAAKNRTHEQGERERGKRKEIQHQRYSRICLTFAAPGDRRGRRVAREAKGFVRRLARSDRGSSFSLVPLHFLNGNRYGHAYLRTIAMYFSRSS